MSLSPGTRLGPYEIVAPLGAGGMGEVYRARDTRLGRDIAIKVLPDVFAGEPERMARFEREAKLLASLNHPNIASIYGLEQAERIRFLAMELVDGEDLSRRLARGPVAVAEVVGLALQVAEALEEAHEKGIVHRDLKPANVVLAADERVKVLDFGLAKALEGGAGPEASDLSRSPTLTDAMTGANVILGTAAYMSPEQARGRRVDKRADIWAFGCLVYEMLVGRRPFEGDTVSDTLASVLKLEPDWGALPRDLPVRLRALLRRCLEKDPKRRLRDIGEARVVLEKIRSGEAEVVEVASSAPASAANGIPPIAVAIALVAVAAAGLLGWILKPAPQPETTWTDLLPPKDHAFETLQGGHFALSPDGGRLAFVAHDSTRTNRLWVRSLSSASSQVLTGTEGATFPFWSPDGHALGFFADGKLKRIDATGGAPLTLSDAPSGRGGTWSPSGVVLFAPSPGGGLSAVSAAGGDTRHVLVPDTNLASLRWPSFLPDGNHFLYCALGESAAVHVGALSGGESRRLLFGESLAGNAAFASGLLHYVQEGALRARPFDPKRLDFTGEAMTIASPVSMFGSYGRGEVTVAPGGFFAFLPGLESGANVLAMYDHGGRRLGAAHPQSYLEDLSFSTDGRRLAVTRQDEKGDRLDVWVYDIDRDLFTRLTFSGVDDDPVWSPDGTRIAWAHEGNIYVKSSSGAGAEEPLLESPEDKVPSQWSPDGRHILYTVASAERDQIWMCEVTTGKAHALRASTQASQNQAQLSRDGRWLAYASTESGEYQVYVQDFPAMRDRWQISRDGGRAPLWKADGTEIYYMDPSGRIIAVRVAARESSLDLGTSTPLFETAAEAPMGPRTHHWVTDPGGTRFVVIELDRASEQRPALTLVQHWRPEDRASHTAR
jgi:Tol biopolymer transport system component